MSLLPLLVVVVHHLHGLKLVSVGIMEIGEHEFVGLNYSAGFMHERFFFIFSSNNDESYHIPYTNINTCGETRRKRKSFLGGMIYHH